MKRKVQVAQTFITDKSGVLFTVLFACTIILSITGFAFDWYFGIPWVAATMLIVISSLLLGRVFQVLGIQLRDLALSFLVGNCVGLIISQAIFYMLFSTVSINLLIYTLPISFTILVFSGWGSRIENGVFKRSEDGLFRFERFEKKA